MDAVSNPFAPHAGSEPPELAGREQFIEQAEIAIQRAQRQKSAQSQVDTSIYLRF